MDIAGNVLINCINWLWWMWLSLNC